MNTQRLPFSFGVKVGKGPSVKFWLLARNVSKYCIGNLLGKTDNVPLCGIKDLPILLGKVFFWPIAVRHETLSEIFTPILLA